MATSRGEGPPWSTRPAHPSMRSSRRFPCVTSEVLEAPSTPTPFGGHIACLTRAVRSFPLSALLASSALVAQAPPDPAELWWSFCSEDLLHVRQVLRAPYWRDQAMRNGSNRRSSCRRRTPTGG